MADKAGEIQTSVALPKVLARSESAKKNDCVVCGAALEVILSGLTDTRFGTRGTYEIRRCVQCGLEQTMPVPSSAELQRLYEEHYNFGGERGTLYTKWRERFLFSFLYRVWVHLDGDVSFHQRRGRGRLLDIGCNEGRGLRIYARNGFQVEGLEPNETAAAVARETGLRVHTGTIKELSVATFYDVAVLSNVLEHSPEPRQMLLDVRRILAPSGQVWISCPNSQSWLRNVFGRSWINWHVPFHTFHFSPGTLRQLLTDSGYAQIEFCQITPALWAAQSLITYLFAEEGRATRQLRNPFLTLFLMVFARSVLFPALWMGNRAGHGDCLVAVATKA